MALSVEKLLSDAHTLIIHLKDHDSLADNIITSTQALYNKVEAMKQYQDDITELNEIAKHRPRSTLVLGIAQENRQIRELQQENRELQATLEEHQSALELIMQKYREHTVKLIHGNRLERALHDKEVADKDSMCHLMDKIDEMAGVMQKAIEVDETVGCADKERVSRLEVENRALREMLEICSTSRERIMVPPDGLGDKESGEGKVGKEDENLEDNEDDDDTDTECDSTVLVASVKEIEEKAEKEEKAGATASTTAAPGVKKKAETASKEKETPSTPTSASGTPTSTTSPSAGSTATGATKGGKAPSPSKSVSEVKKTKTGTVTRSPSEGTVKKTTTTAAGKKEPLKKSSSVETKKDVKGKPVVGKTMAGKK